MFAKIGLMTPPYAKKVIMLSNLAIAV